MDGAGGLICGPISEVSRKATQDRLANYGEDFGVDEKKYQACLNNKPLKDHLANRMDEARNRYQVNGTPAIVVNGKLTLRDGKLTGERAGEIVRRRGPAIQF